MLAPLHLKLPVVVVPWGNSNGSTSTLLTGSSISLLVDIMLGTPLQRLARIVLCVVLFLLGAITDKAGGGTTEGASGPIAETRSEVLNLPSSFLALAFGVLLASGLLQFLCGLVVSDRRSSDCGDGKEPTSEPKTPPTASLALPTV